MLLKVLHVTVLSHGSLFKLCIKLHYLSYKDHKQSGGLLAVTGTLGRIWER
jgi:hypothetical protein